MQRRKQLLTQAARALVTHQLKNVGFWRGRRQGIKIEMKLTPHADFDGNRIEWKARIAGDWKRGKAGTVWDAIQEIETKAARVIQ